MSQNKTPILLRPTWPWLLFLILGFGGLLLISLYSLGTLNNKGFSLGVTILHGTFAIGAIVISLNTIRNFLKTSLELTDTTLVITQQSQVHEDRAWAHSYIRPFAAQRSIPLNDISRASLRLVHIGSGSRAALILTLHNGATAKVFMGSYWNKDRLRVVEALRQHGISVFVEAYFLQDQTKKKLQKNR